MAVDLASDARGLLTLLALLLWPGLLVVRSPGSFVPFLSVSFWLLSGWWTTGLATRSTFLGAALLASFLLSLFRLLKPLPSLRPSLPMVGALACALASLLPLVRLVVAPGLSLASTEATLLVWHDGWPATYEPLLPIPAFGAHAPGLPLLAADLALLSGVPPARAVVLVSLASLGLLVLAAATHLGRAGRPAQGAMAGGAVLAGALLVLSLGGPAPGPAVLSLSLGLAALALLVRGTGRSPAVAAGALLGAAMTVDAFVASGLMVAALPGGGRGRRRLAVALGLVLAAPRLFVLARALEPSELRASATEALAGPWRAPVPDAPALRGMAWLRVHSAGLDIVCIEAPGPGWFLPALSGRAAHPPEVPPVYREEYQPTAHPPCRFRAILTPKGPVSPLLVPPRARRVYEDGGTAILQEQ